MPAASITFPVLRQFEVSGYLLLPGEDGTGVSHVFSDGVSVIAGINGIGKTTLLNALLRVIIGPWDVLREDPDDIGSTRHELVIWRSPGYFSSRVPDRATSATIGAWITFGTERIYVLRGLADLKIQELAHDGKRLEPTEENYQKLVTGLSGTASYYDFHFLVRNLLFYLEDRRPLVWADEGQFEIARVLFVPDPDATDTSKRYDEIKQLDSRYRNLLTEHNRNAKRLRQQRFVQSESKDLAVEAAIAQAAYDGSQEALSRIDITIDKDIVEERALGDDIRRQQLELEESFRAYEGLQQSYFSHAFPQAEETFRYILSHIVADGGCLVCGSDARDKAAELRERMASGRCPVCDSPPDRQERVVGVTEVAAERVNRAARDLDQRRNNFRAICERREVVATRVGEFLEQRRDIQAELEGYRLELDALQARLPASAEAISELEASVKVSQARVDELGRNRADALRSYREVMKRAGSAIENRHVSIKTHFQTCVKAFLEESCELNYRERERTVGQSGERVRFPGFDVMLTSGTFPDTPTSRLSSDDVSESQKEFIDLAFRIALIRTAALGRGAMLILETPEASLDSLFIYRAGDLLRAFADEKGQASNVLVASSNLNDANMIPALLGIDRHPETPAESIDRRMINLLKLGAQNAALRMRKDQYETQYRLATTANKERLPDS